MGIRAVRSHFKNTKKDGSDDYQFDEEPNFLTHRQTRRCSMNIMKKLLTLALALIALASISWASINLNSSKSNIYRVVYSTDAMNPTQVTAVLKELDKSGQVGEAQVRQILQRHGVQAANIKMIFWQPPGKTSKLPTLFLLTDPSQKPAAIAVEDEGAQGPKTKTK